MNQELRQLSDKVTKFEHVVYDLKDDLAGIKQTIEDIYETLGGGKPNTKRDRKRSRSPVRKISKNSRDYILENTVCLFGEERAIKRDDLDYVFGHYGRVAYVNPNPWRTGKGWAVQVEFESAEACKDCIADADDIERRFNVRCNAYTPSSSR